MPTRQMEQTLRLTEERGARVVLLGDTRQTKAIEAGRPFDQLQASGMATAVLGEIERQKDPALKQAVALAARGETQASLARLREVREIRDDHERRRAIAAEFRPPPGGRAGSKPRRLGDERGSPRDQQGGPGGPRPRRSGSGARDPHAPRHHPGRAALREELRGRRGDPARTRLPERRARPRRALRDRRERPGEQAHGPGRAREGVGVQPHALPQALGLRAGAGGVSWPS